MRSGVPVVSSPQRGEAEAALRRAATEIGAHLYFVGQDWTWQPDSEKGTIAISGPFGTLPYVLVPLLGDHQRDNAAVGAASLQLLRERGVEVDDAAIRVGISTVEWSGRVHVLRGSPLVVADAAHNVDSAERLLETVRQEFRPRRTVLVFGASGEKDVAGMARVLGPAAAEVIVTSSGHRRAANTGRLAAAFEGYAPVVIEVDPAAAFRKALDHAETDDLVLITGSVFLAGKAIEILS